MWAIRPGASGDISLKDDETSNGSIAWCQKMGAPYNPTTIVYGDLLYVLLDQGLLACYDAQTGDVVYAPKRLGGTLLALPRFLCRLPRKEAALIKRNLR